MNNHNPVAAIFFLIFTCVAANASPSSFEGEDYCFSSRNVAESLDRLYSYRSIDRFLWKKRPLIIYSSPYSPLFEKQIKELNFGASELLLRNVAVIVDCGDIHNKSLRKKYLAKSFTCVLLGYDGLVKLKKHSLCSVKEISSLIDNMPMGRLEAQRR